jgi:regulator of protease activity HflC (stomatin/prohibitin superfamily)
MVRAIARQAEAERERRAKVIDAEGELLRPLLRKS